MKAKDGRESKWVSEWVRMWNASTIVIIIINQTKPRNDSMNYGDEVNCIMIIIPIIIINIRL